MKNNLFKDKVNVDFKPMTYLEIEQDKPLLIKLDDSNVFETRLMIAGDFIKFNTSKNIILDRLEKLNESKSDSFVISASKVECFRLIVDLLYEISKPKGYFKKRRYYRYLHKKLMNDISFLMDIFDKVLRYNTELKKKAENLLSFDIFSENGSEETAGGQLLADLIKTDPKTGEKYFEH